HVDDEISDAADNHVLQVGQLLLNLIPCSSWALRDECHYDVETGFHRLDRGFADHLHELLAHVLPTQSQHREYELYNLAQLQGLVHINARQGAGELVDECRLEVSAEVGSKVLEPKLGRFHQVAGKRQRVFQDVLKRGAGLFDVAERARAHDIKNDFEQIPDR